MICWAILIIRTLIKNNKLWWGLAFLVYFAALFFQSQAFSGIGITHLWFAVGIVVAMGSSKNMLKSKHKP